MNEERHILELYKQRIDNLNFSLNNGIDLIKQYYIDQRIKVMLKTELAVEKIQKQSEELKNCVNEFEQKLMECFDKQLTKKAKLQSSIIEMEAFYDKWSKILKNPKLDESEIEKKLKKAFSEFEKVISNEHINLKKLTHAEFSFKSRLRI